MLQVTCKAASAGSIKIRLVTGIDMTMADYPCYNTKMTPGGTVAGGGATAPDPGCGTTAAAIMLSPDGKALLWASPQALDSFQMIYNGDYGGHRVNTLALDLISVAPRPA